MKKDNIFLIVIAITCLTIALIMINGVKEVQKVREKLEQVPEWELEQAERKVEIR